VINVIDLTIRLATPDDLPAINDIYNHFVLTSTCTYQTEPETMVARRAWLDAHGHAHPVTVALDGDQVVGWGSLSAFHKRAAYNRTVENSVYVHPQQHRKGIGALGHDALAVVHRIDNDELADAPMREFSVAQCGGDDADDAAAAC